MTNGDYFICDNAPIHDSDDILETLDDTLTVAGVRLIFLPKYSPELNPCESVFGKVKEYLRFHRGKKEFWWEIVQAFACVELSDVVGYYIDCIENIVS